jgi:hypothetical protein
MVVAAPGLVASASAARTATLNARWRDARCLVVLMIGALFVAYERTHMVMPAGV